MARSNDLGLAVRSSGRQPILPYNSNGPILAMLAAGSHLLGAPRHRQPRRQRHPPQSTAGARIAMKKLTLSSYQYLAAHNAVQLIEINRLSDRHFWHEDYD